MPDLNPQQKVAVRYIAGPLLVLAGAGSGKTRVITHKIAHLIDRCEISPRHICAVTFTNKAAREMKARVGRMLEGKRSRGLRVSTFHTLGLNILRREHRTLGYRSGFSILDAQDTESLLRELLQKHALADDAGAGALQWRISGWKNDLCPPERALARAEDGTEANDARLYLEYQRRLKAYNAVDFDDLILQPVRLFQEHRDVLEYWQNSIRYLLVDEYQDTNSSQYELVKLLVGMRNAFTVVGDDDQSIYAWRGAKPENLAQLQTDFPGIKMVKLEQNYRSTARILRCANHLIGHNPHIFEKRLWSDFGDGEPLRVLGCQDEEHEARRVVSEILHHRFTKSASHGDYAVLYRGNHQAKPFEKALREHNIPYFLSGGTSFFARAEVKDVMAYLRLLANPEDDAAFLRVVNVPRREIGPATLEKLAQFANQQHMCLLAASDDPALRNSLSTRAGERLRAFAATIAHFARLAATENPVATARALVLELDYQGWLHATSSSDAAAERRWKNVDELIQWLERLTRDEFQGEPLVEIVRRLALMDILERQEEETGGDRVHLMTLHSAKGLEFPHVVLVGMEEDLLPHRTSIEEENIEEERRLAYVGVTRAQRSLTLTYANKRKRYGELIDCEPSRFLSELPAQDLSWEDGKGERSQEERQQRGTAHLASLRSLLSGS